MAYRSRFTCFISFLVLLQLATAAKLYRMDFRPPSEIRYDGGILSRNTAGTGSVIDHVEARLGDMDPWVSTTSDLKYLRNAARSPGDVFIYYIDPAGLTIVDTAKEFKNAKIVHPKPAEKEFSVRGYVPWANVVKWEVWNRNKKVETVTREEYERRLMQGNNPTPPSSPPRKSFNPAPSSSKKSAQPSPKQPAKKPQSSPKQPAKKPQPSPKQPAKKPQSSPKQPAKKPQASPKRLKRRSIPLSRQKKRSMERLNRPLAAQYQSRY